MFANSLGTDLRIWDEVVACLSRRFRCLRYDKRGHGKSADAPPPYSIAMLAQDAAAIADAHGLTRVVFVGLSIGGLIGQLLAHRRPDLVAGLVLMDTAARIATPNLWQERIATARAGGMAALADTTMERWFSPAFRQNAARLALFKHMFTSTRANGYIGCCHALAAADLTQTTRALEVPTLAMGGSADLATPPDVVREMADLCQAPFYLIKGAGHLPCVEAPRATAALIARFSEGVTHAAP